jgi:ElaB/YqjD/DUF883 family membrane-anchored ribosome-binding protein
MNTQSLIKLVQENPFLPEKMKEDLMQLAPQITDEERQAIADEINGLNEEQMALLKEGKAKLEAAGRHIKGEQREAAEEADRKKEEQSLPDFSDAG